MGKAAHENLTFSIALRHPPELAALNPRQHHRTGTLYRSTSDLSSNTAIEHVNAANTLRGNAEIGDKMKLAQANDLQKVIDLADFNDEEKLGKGKEMQDREQAGRDLQ